MQISKLKLGVCVAALCCGVTGVQAEDTPAQAAARAALYQRMQQADGITNAPMTAPASTPPATSMTPPASTAPAMPVADANDSPAQAAARAALMKRMQDADAAGGQPIEVMTNGAVPPENTSTLTPDQLKAVTDAAAKANAEKAAAEQAEAQKKADADAAQAKAMADAQAKQAADQQAAADAAKAKQAQDAQAAAMNASYPGKELGFQPPPTVAAPISPEKQAKLDALLIQYKADQISPEEYHKQRAEILAGP